MLVCIVVTRSRNRPKVQVAATVSRLQTLVTAPAESACFGNDFNDVTGYKPL